jgi:hypothetical protein
VGGCAVGVVGATVSAPSRSRDLGAEVRTVFSTKCTASHGADLAKPKGRFGYVLDLARVASNPEMVVPMRPDESELWELVKRGQMPPADSRTGPLSAQQKELIREWIDAGAPPPATSVPARSLQPNPTSVQGSAASPERDRDEPADASIPLSPEQGIRDYAKAMFSLFQQIVPIAAEGSRINSGHRVACAPCGLVRRRKRPLACPGAGGYLRPHE